MRGRDLTKAQASRLHDLLFPHVNYFLRLRKRLEELGFDRNDPLYLATDAAYQKAWELSQQAHDLSIRMWNGAAQDWRDYS
jgi:hypothetical protein